MFHNRIALFPCCLVLFAASLVLLASVHAVPSTINLNGTLEDGAGDPLTGTYDWLVRFYDAATAGNQLGGDKTGSVTTTAEGTFNLNLVPPTEVVNADAAWYALAIDVGGDGIDSGDFFGDRFQLHSVPYALTAAAADESAQATVAVNAQQLGGTPAVDYATDSELAAGLGGKSDTGHGHNLQDLSGAVTDAQVPDDITVNQANAAIESTTSVTATVALDAQKLGGTAAADYSTDSERVAGLAGKSDTGHSHNLQDLGGAVTDAQVPDNITITEADTLDSVTGRGASTTNALTVGTLDTGEGANELYAMDQNLRTTDGAVFATLDTGEGVGELHAMDQDVQMTDDVTFNSVTASTDLAAGDFTGASAVDQGHTDTAGSTGGWRFTDQWQSFTAGVSGNLTAVSLRNSEGSVKNHTLFIYDGEGTGGTNLSGAGTAFTLVGTDNQKVINLSSAIPVVSGQQYILRVTGDDTGLLMKSGNVYTGGRHSSDADRDLLFETYVTPLGAVLEVSDTNDEIALNGVVKMGQVSAPSPTTNSLYNDSGNLYWNGTQLDSGGAR